MYPQTQRGPSRWTMSRSVPPSMPPAMNAAAIAAEAGDQKQVAAVLKAIRAADPGFDPEAFLQKAQMTYFLVKKGWTDRNADVARGALSPAIYAWLKSINQEDIANHRVPVLADLNVRGMHVPSAAATRRKPTQSTSTSTWSRRTGYRDDRTLQQTVGRRRSAFRRVVALRAQGRREDAAIRRRGRAEVPQLRRAAARSTIPANARTAGPRSKAVSSIGSSTSMQNAIFEGAMVDNAFEAADVPPGARFRADSSRRSRLRSECFLACGRRRVRCAAESLDRSQPRRGAHLHEPRPLHELVGAGAGLVGRAQAQPTRGAADHVVTPVKVRHGSVYDDVTLRIEAVCADYEVDERTNQIVFGDRVAPPVRGVLDLPALGQRENQDRRRRHRRTSLPELRRAAGSERRGRMQVLPRRRHHRRLRLGPLTHRTGGRLCSLRRIRCFRLAAPRIEVLSAPGDAPLHRGARIHQSSPGARIGLRADRRILVQSAGAHRRHRGADRDGVGRRRGSSRSISNAGAARLARCERSGNPTPE